MARILVVDDDKEIVRVIRAYLEQAGYEVFIAYDGNTALHAVSHERPDLVILDLMLPNKDGLEITQHIRRDVSLAHTYILMLTARIEETDRVVGLELGGDDYVTKPFNPREIIARVRAALRRIQLDKGAAQEEILRYEEIVVDVAKRYVTIRGKPIDLTPTEFTLLAALMSRPSVPFTRAELIQQHLGYDETLDRTLDSHIRNLRKKIELDPSVPVYIHTVYGVGYRLGEP